MEKIDIIQSLVRLSQISEEIENVHPAASALIDSTISNVADQIGVSGNDVQVNEDLFPKAKDPVVEKPTGSDQITDNLTQQIINSPEFKRLLPNLKSEEGVNKLNNLLATTVDASLFS